MVGCVRCFDAYSLLDFSARSLPSPVRPSADACWLGTWDGAGRLGVAYFRTRALAWSAWSDWVGERVALGERVLSGFDFALGYPSGLAAASGWGEERENDGCGSAGWRAVWRWLAERVDEDALNRNNRFAVASAWNDLIGGEADGPFWGGAVSQVSGLRKLRSKRRFEWPYVAGCGVALDRLRRCEERARGAQETWKLAGVGSVGSQSLLGIAGLGRLLGMGREPAAVWAERAKVWPMETGFRAGDGGAGVTLAEAYPSLLGRAVDGLLGRHGGIRDAAQVDAWCRWAAGQDALGRLSGWLGRPAGLSESAAAACVGEEGWILGV